MATGTINSLVKSSDFTVTTNGNGISVISLPVATNTAIAALSHNTGYFASIRPYYSGLWYIVLETYAGERVPNTEVTVTVRYI